MTFSHRWKQTKTKQNKKIGESKTVAQRYLGTNNKYFFKEYEEHNFNEY